MQRYWYKYRKGHPEIQVSSTKVFENRAGSIRIRITAGFAPPRLAHINKIIKSVANMVYLSAIIP